MADDRELKDQRVVTMMSASELTAIDDWMFKNRIRSRGEAIRRLCQLAILLDRRLPRMVTETFRDARATTEAREEVAALRAAGRLAEAEKAQATLARLETTASLRALQNAIAVVLTTSSPKTVVDAGDAPNITAMLEKFVDGLDPSSAADARQMAEFLRKAQPLVVRVDEEGNWIAGSDEDEQQRQP